MKSALGACALFGTALLVAVAAACAFGVEPIGIGRALSEPASLDATILFAARLPRVALAALAGAGLAVVGVAFQGLLRNPLADPYVLGVSGGAALGATLALIAGVGVTTALGASLVSAAALAGALGATVLVYGIARATGDTSHMTILLAGVVVNAIASALITFIKTLVTATKAQELLFWLMGFLDVPSRAELGLCAVLVAAGSLWLLAEAGRLNLLALGAEPASHLGLDVPRFERRVFFAASLIVAAVVSLTGLIGFIGLIVPHAVRRVLGPDHRAVLPASLLLGATALVTCDLGARVAFRFIGTEPPVGAVTALLGGPMFLVLLWKTRARASAS